MADNIPKDYSEYALSGSVWSPENSKAAVPDLLGNMHDVANSATEMVTENSAIIGGGLSDSLSLNSLSGSLVKQFELSSPDVREPGEVSTSRETSSETVSSAEIDASVARIMGNRGSQEDPTWSAKAYASLDSGEITNNALSGLPDPPVAVSAKSRAPSLQKLDNPITPPAPIVMPTASPAPINNAAQYTAIDSNPASLTNRAGALTRLLDDGLLEGGQARNMADKLKAGDIELSSLEHVSTLRDSSFIDLLAEDSGPITRQDATEAISSQQDNREAFARHGLGDVVFNSQKADARNQELGAGPYDGPLNKSTLSSIQQIMGGEDDWTKVSRAVSGAMASSLTGEDPSLAPAEITGLAADKYIQSQADVDPQFKALDDRLNKVDRQKTLQQMGTNATKSVQEKLRAVPQINVESSLMTPDAVDITPPETTRDSALTDLEGYQPQQGSKTSITSLLESSVETADSMSVDSKTLDKLDSGNQSVGRDSANGSGSEISAKTVVLHGATINVTSDDANIQLTGVDSGPASEATATAPAVDG